ncbi:hypothetical protein ACQ4PT_019114 [Festuca glaucescens]
MCLTARSYPFSDAPEKATSCPRRRRSLSRPAPSQVGLAGSRFSVLADGSSSESCLSDQEISSSSSPSASPRSGPERITLDGFLDKAWGLAGVQCAISPADVAASRHGVSPTPSQPHECRGGSPADLDLGLDCFPALPLGAPETGSPSRPSSPPWFLVGSVQVRIPPAGEALVGPEMPVAAATTGPLLRRVEGEATVAPGPVLGLSELLGPDGPVPPGPTSLAQPNRLLRYNWVWTPVGTPRTLVSLQFPASATDLRRFGIQPPPICPESMDRNRADRQPNKRPYEDPVPPAERRRELELRHRAEREQDLRRRDWEREHSPDRWPAGQSFRYDGAGRPAYSQDNRRFQEEGEFVPPRKQKQARHFKPRNPTPAASAPPLSTGGSSQVESIDAEPLASKTKITCFNCSTPGHF